MRTQIAEKQKVTWIQRNRKKKFPAVWIFGFWGAEKRAIAGRSIRRIRPRDTQTMAARSTRLAAKPRDWRDPAEKQAFDYFDAKAAIRSRAPPTPAASARE
jgi:hypothetical protein